MPQPLDVANLEISPTQGRFSRAFHEDPREMGFLMFTRKAKETRL